MTYRAPVQDMAFTLKSLAGLRDLQADGAFPDLSDDLIDAVLEEASKLAADVIAPINSAGDKTHPVLSEDGVVTSPGYVDAYKQWVEAGWGSILGSPEYGGQGLPVALAAALQEMWNAGSMAFGLCPLLSQGIIEALTAHGTDEQRATYLPKLISGEWTGTMNLTEPQAGSDLNALKVKAEPQDDGTYLITGTKIFITYGDHDFTDNIIHLVLARLPDAPAGTRGISLFLVPKILVNKDGSLGARNDAKCIGLEEKLGIHGSPTCVMSFGDEGGAIGYLVGQENKGLACMFTMMNNARLFVGIQGVAVAERAYQHALAYALDRKQGRPAGMDIPAGEMGAIIGHPDVRRNLMTMKSLTEAARSICYANAVAIDTAHAGADDRAKAVGQARADLLTPIAKGWSSDIGVEVASIGLQIHGGMGFIEETGAAQLYRDARIAPIYEGTNGIQAIDLVSRKLPLGDGAVVKTYLAEIRETAEAAAAHNDADLNIAGHALADALDALEEATDWMLETGKSSPDDCLAGATPYAKLFGNVAGGLYLTKAALAAGDSPDDSYLASKKATARFFAENTLPTCAGLVSPATAGAASLFALDEQQLGA